MTTTSSTENREPRRTYIYYRPTPRELKKNNPVGKTEILTWRERAERLLKLRLSRPVTVKWEAWSLLVDADTKEVLKRSKQPKIHLIEKNKLSPQDYQVYRLLVEERYQQLKKEHNERVIRERKSQE